MEGVPRREVKLLPHNPAWDAEFLQTKAQLTDCLQDNIIDIQHVGSTAIPAICAKPILDVAVKLESIHDMDIDALVSHGYDYRGAQGGNDHYHLLCCEMNTDCPCGISIAMTKTKKSLICWSAFGII